MEWGYSNSLLTPLRQQYLLAFLVKYINSPFFLYRLWAVFAFPFALVAIGWKTYMINGAWDVVIIGLMAWYWVETKGTSLEEVDKVIDGEKHSDVPDLSIIAKGKMGMI
jgi:hypothetical protein